MTRGTKIISKQTNQIHIVDEIEIINGETLIFTMDKKCFPIGQIDSLRKENSNLNTKEIHRHEIIETVEFLENLHLIIDISEFPSIPYPKKNIFSRFLDKIVYTFSY